MTIEILKMNTFEAIPAELVAIIQNIYEPAGLKISTVQRETESIEYGACRFSLNGFSIVFRMTKFHQKN